MEHKIKSVLLVAVLLTSAVAGVAVATDDGNVTGVSDTVEQSDNESDWSDGDSDSGGNEDNSTDSETGDDTKTGEDCADEEMKASITFDKQSSDGESVTVQEVTLKEKGYIVIYNQDGNVVGQSEHLEAGTHEDVDVMLNQKYCEDTKLKAVLYADSNGDDDSDWSDGDSDSGDDSDDSDMPAINGDKVVSDWACICIE
ncbi:DUF7282 domain-containing protein [Haladaptatus sp. DFWS20]|uniref:DUF7282 domain-containing protein n=1 Tax=Haladaptatus sp. DFWS20 TaxID=3403467 RepID=UPI003EB7DD34